MPTLFLSHGSPMVAIDSSEAMHFLAHLAADLPRPDAIVVVSAHHQGDPITITSSAHPPTVHDFGPFHPRLFELSYPAPGSPILAARLAERLARAGIDARLDPTRGYDHGAWIPLWLAYPAAEIPVLQLSLPRSGGPVAAAALGRALLGLAEDGVLLVGSGAVTHDLARVFGNPVTAPVPADTDRFADWIAACVASGDLASALAYRAHPDGVRNHPSDEHLLPLFTAWAAAGGGAGRHIHRSAAYGALRMDAFRWH